MRQVQEREYCHERLGEKFAEALSEYDTRRRVEVLVEDFLPEEMVRDKEALDVGCGLGFFSERLQKRGARVTACDLGPSLLEQTRQRVGCECVCADALNLEETFGPERFDLVVSSECIEHTPVPGQAVREMIKVLRPGGYLAFSTPNILWSPVVKLATLARFRPFDGYENFSSWGGLRRVLCEGGMEIVREHGLHLIPFQLRLHRLSRWLDRHCQWARGCMINICLLGRKGPTAKRSA
jgi:2-polyprenyl-3-methyl-5-hydroxy-6-metoxy-1,4-benzoquinol methylase